MFKKKDVYDLLVNENKKLKKENIQYKMELDATSRYREEYKALIEQTKTQKERYKTLNSQLEDLIRLCEKDLKNQ